MTSCHWNLELGILRERRSWFKRYLRLTLGVYRKFMAFDEEGKTAVHINYTKHAKQACMHVRMWVFTSLLAYLVSN